MKIRRFCITNWYWMTNQESALRITYIYYPCNNTSPFETWFFCVTANDPFSSFEWDEKWDNALYYRQGSWIQAWFIWIRACKSLTISFMLWEVSTKMMSPPLSKYKIQTREDSLNYGWFIETRQKVTIIYIR